MNQTECDFLNKAAGDARVAGCPFPEMEACEAALESGWGKSKIAIDANNLFGTKQHVHPIYQTMSLPTREYLGGNWTVVAAKWIEYPSWAACFADRVATLQRLSGAYPHYAAALDAPDAATYIIEVSKTWSTDPQRAAHVQALYDEYMAAVAPANPAAPVAPAAPASSASSAS
jgi:flagellum-specific peptidoglycan hydrolase FlgJ